MTAAHYEADVKELVPWATDGSVDPEDFVLIRDGPHKRRVGFVQQIRDGGFLIIREPPIREEHVDDSPMSVHGSPPPDDCDSRSTEEVKEILPMSVPPLPLFKKTCMLIFGQVLFEVHRDRVLVYKGVRVNDSIQVMQGPMINAHGIVEQVLDNGFLLAVDPTGKPDENGGVSLFARHSFFEQYLTSQSEDI
jgi:hypothetical protein